MATVAGKTPVGTPGGSGDLDTALAVGTRIWTASDAGARIAAVDRSTGAVTQSTQVANRPGGLTEGNGGFLYAFHFLQGTITRIDTATGTATRLQAPATARATGIAYGFVGAGSLWLLTTNQLLELDPTTASVRRTISLQPPFAPRHAFIASWWLVYGDDALWATLPNHDAVVRVDAISGQARYFQLDYGRPFGIAIGAGSAWVATQRAVVRLDEHTGAILGAASLPTANVTGFMSIAFGSGSAWVTNYDRGTLTEVPAAARSTLNLLKSPAAGFNFRRI
jgi:streptogramin lyase